MRSRRTLQVCLAAIAALVACAQFLPGTSSSFTASTSNTGNTVTAGTWVLPSVSATVLQKSQGGITDTIKQGATFYVYANAGESGGTISSVSASVANIATVSTAAMTSGSYTVDGTTYGWRSAQLTAKSTLTSGTYSWSATATDSHGTASSAASDNATVDNTAFDGDNFTWTDNGTAGKFDTGDVLHYVFTKTVDPDSIVDGWDGSSSAVKVAMYDASVYGTGSDILAVGNSALTLQLPVGTAYLGGDYVAAGQTVYYNATMTASGNDVSVTLGSVYYNSGAVRTATTQALANWTEMATPFDAAGNVTGASSLPQFGMSSFAATNKTGGVAGKPEAGDKVTFTYTDVPKLSSIVSGWTSGSQTVTVRLTNGTTDSLSVYNSGNTTLLPLGTVTTGGNYVSANVNFTNSTMVLSGNAIVVTLGTPSPSTSVQTDTGKRLPTWTPDDAVTDAFGAGSSTIPYKTITSITEF